MFGFISKKQVARMIAEAYNRVELDKVNGIIEFLEAYEAQSKLDWLCMSLNIVPMHKEIEAGGSGELMFNEWFRTFKKTHMTVKGLKMIWRNIPGVDPSYEVSFDGEIRRTYKTKQRIIKQYTKKNARGSSNKKTKYCKLRLLDGRRKELLVPALVWKAFKGDIPPDMRIVHRNGIQSDNSVPNLILMTQSQIGKKIGFMARNKTILKVDKQGNVIECFVSTREVEKKDFINRQSVSDRCHFRVKKPFDLNGYTYIWDDDKSLNKFRRLYGAAVDYI